MNGRTTLFEPRGGSFSSRHGGPDGVEFLQRRNQVMTDSRPIPIQVNVTLTALIHPEPVAGGFSAEVPALPGCYTQGETLGEVRANLREAAEAWLAAANDHAGAGK